ncbi:hypothetical protein EIM50_18940 [Pseudoxanthomonas sp. SGD-10]|nr:hypothetical protein EIM50_18940 [Pseudoxanthomonas sp. SGD-10]
MFKISVCKLAVCCLFFFVSQSPVQSQDFTLIARIDTTVKIAKIDYLGNVFVITPKNEVLKYNPEGKFLWNYVNKSFGDITQLDVTDPLRVILYYATHQQILVLNSNLNEIGRFSFNTNPDLQVTLIASANNNGYWAYDQINRELRKLSNSFTDELRSRNIYQRDGFDMQANYMLSNDQYVFINDIGSGIRIFDRFSNYYKIAVIDVKREFEVEGDEIFFGREGKLYSYNFLTFKLQEWNNLPIQDALSFVKRLNRLLIINEKGLTLWSLKN